MIIPFFLSIVYIIFLEYIDEVMSIHNTDFQKFRSDFGVSPGFEIKDTTESNTSDSYLNLAVGP